ncbi:hypothetical protein [Paenibacillus hamazuiensis]|uniref:hypothetical protein n=1 Tax=Paenibacillus hamazuiensis TaxID=2936508 RepID=UPI00200C6E86|nr:hypothetical protein [Paenibacillus hamazuiensis]
MKRTYNRLTVLLLVCALIFGNAVTVLADGDGGAEEGVPTLGKVNITDNSFFELKDVYMLPDQGSKNVAFTVTIHNNDSTDLMFIDYWVHLLTKSGNQISVKILPEFKDKNRITPKSTQDIGFYATVNEKTELSDLVFRFIKWDFSQPNFERNLGEISVSDSYSVVTPAGGSRIVKMTGIPMKTSIKKLLTSKNEKNYNATVVFVMQNVGTKSIAVPAYQFAIRTSEGYMYPLEAKNLKDLTIDPQVDKELELSGSLPVSVSPDGWQLVIIQNIADLKLNLSVAYYELPAVTETEGVDVGKDYTFTTKKGLYHAKVTAFNRMPWEDQDMLTANLVLSNQGVDALPIPDLTGYFFLDEAVKIEAKLIRTDNIIGLPVGSSINFQFIGKLPYTYNFSKVKLVLQEKESDTKTNDLLEFVNSSEMMNIPYNNVGEKFTVQHVGRNASYKVRNVHTFLGDANDTFMVQLEVENLEKRSVNGTKLVAQFKTPDGTVYPATINEVKKKINPGGKALLFLWANVPKGFPATGLHLLIGEAITEGKLTEGDGKPDGYINGSAYWLPEEDLTVQKTLDKLVLAPYTFTINHISTWLNSRELRLTFNYELTRDLLLETNTEGRKLIITFEDEKGAKTFSREFDFKDFDASEPNDGTKDTKIRLGKVEKFEIKETDEELIYKLETLKTYRLSVYDSFQGQKKLIGTQEIAWFSITD